MLINRVALLYAMIAAHREYAAIRAVRKEGPGYAVEAKISCDVVQRRHGMVFPICLSSCIDST